MAKATAKKSPSFELVKGEILRGPTGNDRMILGWDGGECYYVNRKKSEDEFVRVLKKCWVSTMMG